MANTQSKHKGRTSVVRKTRVVGYIRDVDRGATWGILRFTRHDGTRGERFLPRGDLRLPGKIRAVLDPEGVNYDKTDLKRIVKAHEIDNAKVTYRYSDLGWRPSGRFGFPGRTIHEDGHDLALMPTDDDTLFGAFQKRAGDLQAWNDDAVPAIAASSFALFAAGVIFAGGLFRFSNNTEGVTFAFSGDEGVGKTSCCVAAQAVMGDPDRHLLPSWDASRTGFKDLLSDVRDFALIIDDTSRDSLPPAERLRFWADIGHAIAGGGKRNVARAYQAQHGPAITRRPTVALTSGEIAPDELARLTGGTVMGGVRVRFINIPVPPKKDGGVFDIAVEGTDAADIGETALVAAETLQAAIAKTHGVAFGPFIDFLETNYADLPHRVRKIEAAFVKAVKNARKGKGSGSNLRIARKFGLVLAGLILAIKAGSLAISPALARQAVHVCFDAAMRRQDRDRVKRTRDARALKEVLRDPEQVPRLKRGQEPKSADLGFRRELNGVEVGFMRADQIGRALNLDDAGVRDLVAHLAKRGKLMPGTGGDRTRPVKVGARQIRHYVFRPAFFAKPKKAARTS
jgi:hypothetical protein